MIATCGCGPAGGQRTTRTNADDRVCRTTSRLSSQGAGPSAPRQALAVRALMPRYLEREPSQLDLAPPRPAPDHKASPRPRSAASAAAAYAGRATLGTRSRVAGPPTSTGRHHQQHVRAEPARPKGFHPALAVPGCRKSGWTADQRRAGGQKVTLTGPAAAGGGEGRVRRQVGVSEEVGGDQPRYAWAVEHQRHQPEREMCGRVSAIEASGTLYAPTAASPRCLASHICVALVHGGLPDELRRGGAGEGWSVAPVLA